MPNPAPYPSSRTLRRWAVTLLAAAAWNLWVWATRLVNLANDDIERTTGFLVVHTVLFVVSLGFAAAVAAIGWRLRGAAGARDVGAVTAPGDVAEHGARAEVDA